MGQRDSDAVFIPLEHAAIASHERIPFTKECSLPKYLIINYSVSFRCIGKSRTGKHHEKLYSITKLSSSTSCLVGVQWQIYKKFSES